MKANPFSRLLASILLMLAMTSLSRGAVVIVVGGGTNLTFEAGAITPAVLPIFAYNTSGTDLSISSFGLAFDISSVPDGFDGFSIPGVPDYFTSFGSTMPLSGLSSVQTPGEFEVGATGHDLILDGNRNCSIK